MNNVLFRRGDQTFIDENVPLYDGQIIFNETDEAIYLDVTINNNVVRKRYGGGNLSRSDIDMAFSTTSENPIANKVVTNAIGSLSSLQTNVKTNLVGAINEVNTKAVKTEVLIINVSSFSSLPQTVSNANIESDMVVVNSVLSNPSAQKGDWTVTTSNGSLTISGTSAISGSTTLSLYLMKSR
jgi:3-dehydroquinate dehydratase